MRQFTLAARLYLNGPLQLMYLSTTPGHTNLRFDVDVQNHVFEAKAPGTAPHSPPAVHLAPLLHVWSPPREEMALGKANCPQPITIQLPPPAGSKPAPDANNLAYLRF